MEPEYVHLSDTVVRSACIATTVVGTLAMPPRSGVQDVVFLVASVAHLTEASGLRRLQTALMLSKVP